MSKEKEMKGIINIKAYRNMLNLKQSVPNFPTRVIHHKRKLQTIFSKWHNEPLTFYRARVNIGNTTLPVILNPVDGQWYPSIKEDNIPLLIWDLIDYGYLEKHFANPALWKDN